MVGTNRRTFCQKIIFACDFVLFRFAFLRIKKKRIQGDKYVWNMIQYFSDRLEKRNWETSRIFNYFISCCNLGTREGFLIIHVARKSKAPICQMFHSHNFFLFEFLTAPQNLQKHPAYCCSSHLFTYQSLSDVRRNDVLFCLQDTFILNPATD